MITVERDIFGKIVPWLGEKKILVVKGARQTGKTTLLRQIEEYLIKQGKRVIYFSVDQELTNPVLSDPRYLLRFLKDQEDVSANNPAFILLDEFQYIKTPGLFLKVLFDLSSDYLQVIATGSSALEISKEKEFLTGRKIEFIMERFSFIEFLRASSSHKYNYQWKVGDSFADLSEFYQVYRKDLEQHCLEYINWGGYPEISLTRNNMKKETILKEIISTYTQKDVSDFLKVENISGFNKLVVVLAMQIGDLINKNEIANTLGINYRTLNSYLDILRHTFIYSFLPPYYSNIRKELAKMPKVYADDLGIIRFATGATTSEYSMIPGNLAENFVFLHLKNFGNIYFYRTHSGGEIDFLIKESADFIPVEVKFRKKPQLPRMMKNFSRTYPVLHQIVLTRDMIAQEKSTYFIPIPVLPFIDPCGF